MTAPSFSVLSGVALALMLTASAGHSDAEALSAQAVTPADEAQAEELFREGKALMAEGYVHFACPKFALAKRIGKGGGAALALAVCHEKDGQLVAALAEFRDALVVAEASNRPDRVSLAHTHIAQLERTVSTLTIVAPTGVHVRLNDAPWEPSRYNVPIPVDPGDYVVRAEAAGKCVWQVTVHVGLVQTAQRLDVPNVDPMPAPTKSKPGRAPIVTHHDGDSHSSSKRLVLARLAIGVGAAAIGGSAYAGLSALSERTAATCGDRICPGKSAQYEHARSMATAATAIGAIGLAAIGSGFAFLITSHKGSDARNQPTRFVPRIEFGASTVTVVSSF